MNTAIYPGTFDPFTLGHEDIAMRASAMFDRLIVAVSESGKTTLFSATERLFMAQETLKDLPSVEVVLFKGLLVDVCAQHKASVVVRGIRSFADFEYEAEMASLNRQMSPLVDTVFLSTTDSLRSISGSRVREIAKLGGRYQGFVSREVSLKIAEKIANRA
jgi:pantetheine-phosphate adenylyltransferase